MEQSFLIFDHYGSRYGLDVTAVRELVWLPGLSPVEELPACITGVFNLKGQVIPAMDLCQRFGHARETYRLSDRVVVIAGEAGRVGLIVSELHDLITLPSSAIAPARSYQGAGGEAQFVWGQAMTSDGLVMLLNIPALLRSAPPPDALPLKLPAHPAQLLSALFGELSPVETRLLQQRTAELAQPHSTTQEGSVQAYAVIRFDSEFFALNLDQVREFSPLRGIVPVPCCPPHILGNMNLRGDILTVADIRPALGLNTQGALSEIVVVQASGLLFGLPASEVLDVIHLSPQDIAPMPAVAERALKAYCKGVASAGERTLGLLDLEEIIAARELQVAQEVL